MWMLSVETRRTSRTRDPPAALSYRAIWRRDEGDSVSVADGKCLWAVGLLGWIGGTIRPDNDLYWAEAHPQRNQRTALAVDMAQKKRYKAKAALPSDGMRARPKADQGRITRAETSQATPPSTLTLPRPPNPTRTGQNASEAARQGGLLNLSSAGLCDTAETIPAEHTRRKPRGATTLVHTGSGNPSVSLWNRHASTHATHAPQRHA